MGQGGDWNTAETPRSSRSTVTWEPVKTSVLNAYRMPVSCNAATKVSTIRFHGGFNHDGYTDVVIMSYQNGRHIDLYLNDKGTGRFIRQEIDFEAATNGSVMFGDLNNDGWLDIEYSGYSDKTSRPCKTYINRTKRKLCRPHARQPHRSIPRTIHLGRHQRRLGHWTSSAPETATTGSVWLLSIIIRQTVPDICLSATSRKTESGISRRKPCQSSRWRISMQTDGWT